MSQERVVVVGAGMVGHRFVEELVRAGPGRPLRRAPRRGGALRAVQPDPALRRPRRPLRPGRAGDAGRRSGSPRTSPPPRSRWTSPPASWSCATAAGSPTTGWCWPPVPGRSCRRSRASPTACPATCTCCAASTTAATWPPGRSTPGTRSCSAAALLGLEAACALVRRGVQVTVVHVGTHLAQTQLDAAPADVLARSLGGLGVDVRIDTGVEEVRTERRRGERGGAHRRHPARRPTCCWSPAASGRVTTWPAPPGCPATAASSSATT